MGITTQMNLSSAESDEYLSNSLLSLLDYTPYREGMAVCDTWGGPAGMRQANVPFELCL